MQDLQNLEIFEIEVLDLLNSKKIIDSLYFGGGTMLRLCHNLNRYSTDLDFWLEKNADSKILFRKIKDTISKKYNITDAAEKKYTLLFEFKAPHSRRSLKIEIRKEQENFEWERKIAFSQFERKQVLVKGLTLKQMMKNKVKAFLSRKIIRDCFDIEFLLMKGIELPSDRNKLENILKIITNFKDKDYKVTLGSILEKKERNFYIENKFKFLREEINKKLISF